MKIIPAIDLMEGKVVRLYKGDPSKKTIYSDDSLDIAKKWQSAGADMLHLVDLDATLGSCLLYTSPSPRDKRQSRMPSSA